MTSHALPNKRPHWHAPERGTGPAFALSLFAHAILFFAIAFVVRWKTEPLGTVSAELWGGFPAAAPAAAPVPPPIVAPAPPPPPPKVEPAPEPERKADIVMEQKKPEPPKKVEPPKKIEPPKPVEPPKKAEPPKPDPRKLEAQKREAAQAEAAARNAEDRRQQEMKRLAAAAGSSGPTGSGATAVAGGTGVGGGFSDSYKGQIVGCVRPHIVFNVPDGVQPKQYVTEFEVQLLPTGEQATAPKLLKASGLAAYDQAVERAIRRCDPFPRPKDGAMPRSLRLSFDPVDTR